MKLFNHKHDFGPGVMVKLSRGEFLYRTDAGETYYSDNCSLYWSSYMEGKHYDWVDIERSYTYIKAVRAQETL